MSFKNFPYLTQECILSAKKMHQSVLAFFHRTSILPSISGNTTNSNRSKPTAVLNSVKDTLWHRNTLKCTQTKACGFVVHRFLFAKPPASTQRSLQTSIA